MPDELFGVTKAMFQEYEELRVTRTSIVRQLKEDQGGITNMYGARPYLGWAPGPFIAVLDHYSEMAAAWPDVLKAARKPAAQTRGALQRADNALDAARAERSKAANAHRKAKKEERHAR